MKALTILYHDVVEDNFDDSGFPGAAAARYKLTEREREVLAAIARGQLNKQIAADLDISVRTVESHRSAIRQKTGGGNAARLARIAAELGL